MVFGRSHAWLRSAIFSWNSNDLPLTQAEVTEIFLEDLLTRGVIVQRKDLTAEQKLLEEEDQREDAMRRKSVAVSLTSDAFKEKSMRQRRASAIIELDLDELQKPGLTRLPSFKPLGEALIRVRNTALIRMEAPLLLIIEARSSCAREGGGKERWARLSCSHLQQPETHQNIVSLVGKTSPRQSPAITRHATSV